MGLYGFEWGFRPFSSVAPNPKPLELYRRQNQPVVLLYEWRHLYRWASDGTSPSVRCLVSRAPVSRPPGRSRYRNVLEVVMFFWNV